MADKDDEVFVRVEVEEQPKPEREYVELVVERTGGCVTPGQFLGGQWPKLTTEGAREMEGSTASPKRITVYVRLADDEKGRELSFKIPPELSPRQMLDDGFTIDGDQAVVLVRRWDDGYSSSLLEGCEDGMIDALRETEEKIVEYLEEHDYEVDFR